MRNLMGRQLVSGSAWSFCCLRGGKGWWRGSPLLSVILSSDSTFCRKSTNRWSSSGNNGGGKGVSPLVWFGGGGAGKLSIVPGRLIVGVAGVGPEDWDNCVWVGIIGSDGRRNWRAGFDSDLRRYCIFGFPSLFSRPGSTKFIGLVTTCNPRCWLKSIVGDWYALGGNRKFVGAKYGVPGWLRKPGYAGFGYPPYGDCGTCGVMKGAPCDCIRCKSWGRLWEGRIVNGRAKLVCVCGVVNSAW